MRNLLLLGLLLARAAFGGCSTLTIPTDYLTIDAFRRANQAANWTATATAHNNCKDSTNLILQRVTGLNGSMWLKPPQDFIVQLDADNNGTNKFFLLNGNADTLFRVSEDSTTKFFGPLSFNKRLVLSDSLIGVSERLTGNLAAVNGAFSGTLGATGAAVLGSTLNVKGIQTDSAALTFGGAGTAADWSLWRSAANGLSLRGGTGSSYDFSLFNPAANYLMRNPTGTQSLEFPGTGSNTFTGKVVGSDTVATALGLRIGSVAASSVNLYRASADVLKTDDSLSVAGNININGATNTLDWGLNAANKHIAVTSGRSVYAFGLGDPSATQTGGNAEYIRMVHDGTNGIIQVNKSSGGSFRPLTLVTSGVTALTIAIDQKATFSSTVTVDSLISQKVSDEGSFTGTLSTGCTTTPTLTGKWVRVYKMVNISFWLNTNCTSNSTSFQVTGISPAPPQTRNPIIPIARATNNSATVSSVAVQPRGSTWDFFNSGSATGWTSSGTKGLVDTLSITYGLQ